MSKTDIQKELQKGVNKKEPNTKTKKQKKVIHDEIFRGKLSFQNYFEGWYFKFVSKEKDQSFALIPGISLKADDRHAFIQYINGTTGSSEYFRFSVKDFSADKKDFEVSVGENYFSLNKVEIQLKNEKTILSGSFTFSDIREYPSTLISPTIMGPFSYVPKMECIHGVVSMHHNISGNLSINENPFSFSNGSGYIEKDRGFSFPKSWIWMQSNSFSEEELSFMLSVAEIPWMGRSFTGFLGFIYNRGKVFRFGTYTGARIKDCGSDKSSIILEIRDGKYLLKIKGIQGEGSSLIAPEQGKMVRVIKESINSKIELELINRHSGENILRDTGFQAGLEISGDIQALIRNRQRVSQ